MLTMAFGLTYAKVLLADRVRFSLQACRVEIGTIIGVRVCL